MFVPSSTLPEPPTRSTPGFMQYRSYADLSRTLMANLRRVPADVDLVVGVPRSGTIPATILALALNLPITSVTGLVEDRIIAPGRTRRFRPSARHVSECHHALVIDTSVHSGATMEAVREQLRPLNLPLRITYAAVFVTPESAHHVDLFFDLCTAPRAFEWDLLHHSTLNVACVDIDGVLCVDPTCDENDGDGPRYQQFLDAAIPYFQPNCRVHHLVTSRLERYRPQTEAWLQRHGVQYDRLSMLDLPDAATRRRLAAHGTFKASVYQNDAKAMVFIESEPAQAEQIARLTGKPVICVENRKIYRAGDETFRLSRNGRRGWPRLGGRVARWLRSTAAGSSAST